MAKTGDFLKKFGYQIKERISTGVLPLDIVLNGGIELGGCYCLSSPPGGGKTTMFLQVAKHACDNGRFVVYADIEQGLKTEQIEGAGLSKYLEPIEGEQYPRFYWINNLYSYSDFQNLCRELINLKKEGIVSYDIIMADSLSTLVAQNILDGDCEAATIAADARPLSKLIKSVRPPLGVAGITLFNIVQAASNVGGGMWEPEWVAKVTKSIEHAVDGLILLEHPTAKSYQIWGKKKTPSGEEDVIIGYYGKLYTTKARSGLNRIKLVIPMIMGVGCDNVQYLLDTLCSTGVVARRGQTYKYKDADGNEQRIDGDENFKSFVTQNYSVLVKMMYDLGYYNLTNTATVEHVAMIEPSEVAGAGVSQEELHVEGDTVNNEQFI